LHFEYTWEQKRLGAGVIEFAEGNTAKLHTTETSSLTSQDLGLYARKSQHNTWRLQSMTTRMLGASTLNVSPLCRRGNVFGWTADEKTSFAILDALVAARIRASIQLLNQASACGAATVG
jgi:hypothetical protein